MVSHAKLLSGDGKNASEGWGMVTQVLLLQFCCSNNANHRNYFVQFLSTCIVFNSVLLGVMSITILCDFCKSISLVF